MKPTTSGAPAWARTVAAATALLLAAAGTYLSSTASQAESLSQVGIEKTVSSASAPIGTSVVYSLALDCFSTTDGCLGVSITDQLPAGLSFAGFVPSAPAPSFATWGYDAASRVLTIDLVAPLASGSTPTISYAATITADGSVVDGTVLTNTATITASNAVAPDTSSAQVAATYSPFGRVTSAAVWDDEDATASGIEFSDKASTLTVSGLNQGSRNADSLTISVPGTADPIFDSFDATSISGVLPAGATDATVTLTLADGSTITPAVTLSGSSFTLPAGLDYADVVGASVTFTGSIAGTAVLGAPAVSAGTLVIATVQRDTQRGSGADLITNGVDRTITGGGHVSITYPEIAPADCNDCVGDPTDTYLVVYPQPAVTVVKSDYLSVDNTQLIEGLHQEVSNTITATNTSAGGIGSLTIVDAQPGLDNPFADDDIDLARLSLAFPAGAEKAVVTIHLPSGDQQFTLTASITDWVPPLIGADLADATGFEVSFLDTNDGYLATNAAAIVTVVSTINNSVTVLAPGAGNSAQATVTSAVLTGSAGIAINTTGATAPLVVFDPQYSIALTKRVTNPFLYLGSSGTTQFRQTATVGAATATPRVVIQDPVDSAILDQSNPFRAFDAVKVIDTTVPTDATLNVSYFDSVTSSWKPVSGFQGLTGLVQADLPADVRSNALGLRYEYLAISGTFAPGRVFAANFQAKLRTTDRVSDATVTAGDYRNCSAAWLGADPDGGEAGPENALVELSGSACPKVTLAPRPAGTGVPAGPGVIDKITPFKEVKEQSEKRGSAASDVTDSLIYTYVPFAVVADDVASISLEDSAANAPQWWNSFDLETIGAGIPGATGHTLTTGAIRLTLFQKATISWLDVSGTVLGSTIIEGAGTDQATGTALQVDVASATAAASVAYESVAGYRIVFAEATDGGQPLAGDPEPGQLENAFFGQYSDMRGIEIPMQFQIRATDRQSGAPVLDENCYGFDGNFDGTLDCDSSVVDYLPMNSGDGDEGWVNNVAVGGLTLVGGETWSGATDNDESAARIVPAIVDVKNTTTFVRPVAGSSTPATDMGVPASGTAAADYPRALGTATTTLVQEVPVDSLVLSLPQVMVNGCTTPTGPPCYLPVPSAELPSTDAVSPFDYFDLVGVTLSTTGATIGSISADVTLADGSQVTLGPLGAAGLTAAINALPNLTSVVGIKLTALPGAGSSGIAAGSAITAALDLRLRPTVRSTGQSMQHAVTNTTRLVNLGSLSSATDVVANDHAASSATLLLRAAGPGVSATKSFLPTTGFLDLLPSTQVTIPASNSGEVPVDRLVISDLDDAAGISDTWNAFDLVSVDAITAPRSNGVIAADRACVRLATWSPPGTVAVPNCTVLTVDATTGVFTLPAGFDASAVRGIVVEFFNADGARVATSRAAGDAAKLVFTVALRSTLVSTGAKVTSATITNSADVAVVLGGVTTKSTVNADYNPLTGSPKLDVEKRSRSAATGAYDQIGAVATSGDLIDYALVVRNLGTASVVNPSVVDLPPAQLLLSPSANSGFDIDRTADGVDTWTPLPASDAPTVSIAASGVVTWTYPSGFSLAPGESLRVRTAFQVAAGTSGSITNVVGTPVANASQCPTDTYNAQLGLCTTTHVVVVSLRGGILIEKLSKGALGVTNQVGGTGDCAVASDPGFTKFPCVAIAPTSDSFQYRVKLTNNGGTGLGAVVLTDKLPGVGDTALTVGTPVGDRYGEWASSVVSSLAEFSFERVSTSGAVSTIPSSAISAFQTSGAVCAADVDAQSATTCAAGDWTPWTSGAPATMATGIQFAFDLSASPLLAGETVRVTWSAATLDAPITVGGDVYDFRGAAGADGLLTQWNTVAGAGTGSGTTFAGESSKAGATMDLGQLLIEKTLVDDRTVASDGGEVFTFEVSCSTPGGIVVATHEFTITAAELASGAVDLAFYMPAGSLCTVTETDSDGAVVTPQVQTVSIVTGKTATASIENRFSDALGSLLLTKRVVGTTSPATVYAVTLTRLDATATPIVVQLTAGQTASVDDLPIGARYSVVETTTGGAAVTYQGLTDGAVTVGGSPVSVIVVNTFTDLPTHPLGSITLTKKVVGDAPDGGVFDVTLTRLDVAAKPIVVQITAGKTIVIDNLPVDARYSVVETVTGGAVVTYAGLADGAVVVSETPTTVTVTNTFELPTPPIKPSGLAFTGVTGITLLLLIAGAALAGGAVLIVARRRQLR